MALNLPAFDLKTVKQWATLIVNKHLSVNIEVMAETFYSDRFFYVYSCDLNVNVQIKM